MMLSVSSFWKNSSWLYLEVGELASSTVALQSRQCGSQPTLDRDLWIDRRIKHLGEILSS